MRALSIRPPWDYAIEHLGKRVECRSWQPRLYLIGETIALHCSTKRDIWADNRFEDWPVLPIDPGIFGVAKLAYVATAEADVPADQRQYVFSRYIFVLEQVRLISPRIIVGRGHPYVWRLPGVIEAAIREALEGDS